MSEQHRRFVLHPSVPARWVHGFHPLSSYTKAWQFSHDMDVGDISAMALENLVPASLQFAFKRQYQNYLLRWPGERVSSFLTSLLNGKIDDGFIQLLPMRPLQEAAQIIMGDYPELSLENAMLIVVAAVNQLPLIVDDETLEPVLAAVVSREPLVRVVWLADYERA